LQAFPHGCSEQITSAAFCRLLLADEADFGLNRAEVNKQLDRTFGTLRRRQNDQGLFGYWAPETGDHISFVSAYVMDFLSEAKRARFNPSQEMFASGLLGLQKIVRHDPDNLSDARTVAYAIYVLTREGVVTTNYILNLEDYLEKHHSGEWQNDLTGVYLAGALHGLHKDADAEKLIAQYRVGDAKRPVTDDFCQPLGSDSQYLAVLARDFPARLKKISGDQLENILRPIRDGEFNTLSAAYAVRALKAYSETASQNLPETSVTEIRADKSETALWQGRKLIQRTDFSDKAKNLRIKASGAMAGSGMFFQVVQAGFDRATPTQAISKGIEVYRELLGNDNLATTTTKIGEQLRVRLHVRSITGAPLTNVAVIDLLPGGFEIVDSTLRGGPSTVHGVDYVDIREDRALFYATVPESALEIDYQIKSVNRGEFTVPPPFAESMYDRNVKARGKGSRIKVTQ